MYVICIPQIKLFEKQECVEERRRIARDIYDNFIMKELLAHSHVSIICLYKNVVSEKYFIFPRIYNTIRSFHFVFPTLLFYYMKLVYYGFHLIHFYLLLCYYMY